LQKRLQKELADKHYGELPVGQAVIVPTEHEDIPWLVSAPTMRIPMFVSSTPNAYLAFRAALIAIKKHNDRIQHQEEMANGPVGGRIESVLCPGLGTAVGRMPFNVCAKQMFYAYMTVVKGEKKEFASLGDCVNNHFSITRDS